MIYKSIMKDINHVKFPFSIEIMQHTDSLQKISKYLSELETRHIKPEGS